MSLATVIVPAAELAGERVEIVGDPFRHLFRSRRLPVGARLRLVDGAGGARWGRVTSVRASSATVELAEAAPGNESPLEVELWVGLPRPRRAAWMIEKTTEVGVAAIRWLDSSRSGRALPAAALERQRRVARAAVEQSGRSRVPEISGLHTLDDLVARLEDDAPTWVLDPDDGARLDRGRLESTGAARVVVGPEGGFESMELERLRAAGTASLALGPRVLRVETAAVVAVALLLAAAPGGPAAAL